MKLAITCALMLLIFASWSIARVNVDVWTGGFDKLSAAVSGNWYVYPIGALVDNPINSGIIPGIGVGVLIPVCTHGISSDLTIYRGGEEGIRFDKFYSMISVRMMVRWKVPRLRVLTGFTFNHLEADPEPGNFDHTNWVGILLGIQL